jgi:hypothetical protein
MRTRRFMRTALAVFFGGALLVGASVFFGPAAASQTTASTGVSPLTLLNRPTPLLSVPHYRTIGNYPQFSLPGSDLSRVNVAIRDAVLAEQQRYAPIAILQEARDPDPIRLGYKGLFATQTAARLTSASTAVVSALIPLGEIFPGGHASGSWLSVTVQVPSARPIRLEDLLARPSDGLRALAAAARQRVISGDRCVRGSVSGGDRGYLAGFAPTFANYQHFALVPTGAAVGFSSGQVANGVCNRVEVTIPYKVMRPYWSDRGRRIVAAVRKPR